MRLLASDRLLNHTVWQVLGRSCLHQPAFCGDSQSSQSILLKLDYGAKRVSYRMLEAAKRAGFSAGKDVNDPRLPTSGAFLIHHTIDRSGHRNSTFRAFLTKEFALAHQNNLHICVNTIVRKVELDREDDGSLRAVGVSIQADAPGSASISVKASREIIVCSGALRTPQILMLRYEIV